MEAVIYARVSSTDESQSFDRQLDDLKKWSKYKNLEIVKTFAEKVSGFRKGLDERVEFNKMQSFIEKESIKHILVSELSIVFRRYMDTLNFNKIVLIRELVLIKKGCLNLDNLFL
jgi:DNA invertase Pin-like site-specific DNA recombinase